MNTTMSGLKAAARAERKALKAAVRAALEAERRAFERWRRGKGGEGWEELEAAGERVKAAEEALVDWNPW